MPRKPDYLAKHIKTTLSSIVGPDGFKLYRPKVFVRVRGPFVDEVSFQLSQYGSKTFYVHYFTNLLAYPLLDIDSYTVGQRISECPGVKDEVRWHGATDEGALEAIHSVGRAYETLIRPWFSSVGSIPGYVFESLAMNRGSNIETLEFATAFLEAGNSGRAWWICSDILQQGSAVDSEVRKACQEFIDTDEAEKLREILNNETYTTHREQFADLPVPETAYSSVESLKHGWRARNLERYGLKEFVVKAVTAADTRLASAGTAL